MGDTVKVVFPSTGTQEFTVESILLAGRLRELGGAARRVRQERADQFDNQIYIKTSNGVTPENTAALKKVVAEFPGPKLETRDQFKQTQVKPGQTVVETDLRAAVLRHRDRRCSVSPTTLGLSIIERTHELGLLRAVGMTRRQLRSSVRWESVIISLLGTFLGLVIGVVFAWALVHALADQGIDQFSLAPVQLLVIVVAHRRVRRDRRHLARAPSGPPRHPRVDPHRVGVERDVWREPGFFTVSWLGTGGPLGGGGVG